MRRVRIPATDCYNTNPTCLLKNSSKADTMYSSIDDPLLLPYAEDVISACFDDKFFDDVESLVLNTPKDPGLSGYVPVDSISDRGAGGLTLNVPEDPGLSGYAPEDSISDRGAGRLTLNVPDDSGSPSNDRLGRKRKHESPDSGQVRKKVKLVLQSQNMVYSLPDMVAYTSKHKTEHELMRDKDTEEKKSTYLSIASFNLEWHMPWDRKQDIKFSKSQEPGQNFTGWCFVYFDRTKFALVLPGERKGDPNLTNILIIPQGRSSDGKIFHPVITRVKDCGDRYRFFIDKPKDVRMTLNFLVAVAVECNTIIAHRVINEFIYSNRKRKGKLKKQA